MRNSPNPDPRARARSELRTVLTRCRHAFLGIGLMTGMINMLYLTGSFFMLEVYDRVLPSRSVPTLVGLAVIAFVLYAFQGVLDVLRGRVLVRIGASLDEALGGRVFDILVRLPLKARPAATGCSRSAISTRSAASCPASGRRRCSICLGCRSTSRSASCSIVWIGVAALLGAVLLIVVTLADRVPHPRADEERGYGRHGAQRARRSEPAQRRGPAGDGHGRAHRRALGRSNAKYMASQQRASDVAGGLGALSKVMRMALQSGVLGIGAYLVIEQQATAGVIIASSILTSRALAPVELAIANWRGFVAARQSWRRLTDLLAALPTREAPMALPRPSTTFSVEGVSATPPGVQRFVVQDVAFSLKAGNGLGIIGPSASGKSSLARLLVGVWTPVRGKVRLDGAAFEQWRSGGARQAYRLSAAGRRAVRRHRGAEHRPLRAGARRRGDPRRPPRRPNVHDLILRLADGYDTQIGEGGAALSAGQRQRIALARALYRDPFLLVLDEPNSNLDAEGEEALTQAILGARARGGIVIVIAHRPSALAGVDLILMMADGKAADLRPEGRGAEQGAPPPRRPRGRRGRTIRAGRRDLLKVVETQERRREQGAVPGAAVDPPPLLGGLAVVALLAGGVGGWAATTELSGAVIAPGSLVVDRTSRRCSIRPAAWSASCGRGTATRSRRAISWCASTRPVTQANLAIVVKSLNELQARLARLEAERDNVDTIVFPAELLARADDPELARSIDRRAQPVRVPQERRAGQKAQLRERIAQLQEEIQGLTGQVAAKKRETELIGQELEGVRDLWRKNLVQIQRVTALERDAARLEGERGQLIASTAQAKGKISEIELQILQIDQDLRSEVAKDLREVQGKIAELVERKVAAEDQLKRIDIRAPQNGMVHQSTVHTVGGVITPGEAIMLIVPEADALTVEAKIAPQDIDQVRVGQTAALRFSAFSQRTTPELNGVVSRVSADLTTDQRTGAAYYVVRITLSDSEIARLEGLRLVPGMPVEAFIRTGERTVLSYVMKPFTDQITRSFRSR